MIPAYSTILLLHIVCVGASATLFSVRGLATIAGARWTMADALRYSSYTIDTLLLAAGASLAILSHQYPLSSPWLTAKLLLLVAYIVFGSFALKRARSRRAKAVFFIASLAVLTFMVSIAVTHNPLGFIGERAP